MSPADDVRTDHGPSPDDGVPGWPPLWVRTRVDRSTLDAARTLAHAVARHWASDEAAGCFGHAVGLAATLATATGPATLDLWEDPGALVCHIARSGPAPGPSPPATGPAGSAAGPGHVLVSLREDEVTVRLTL